MSPNAPAKRDILGTLLLVQAGNQHASKHSAPGLWALLARLGRTAWPCLLRGDCDWGTEANMSRAEREGLPYLFKLRLTRNAQLSVPDEFSLNVPIENSLIGV